jgi:hypothetical protein
MVNSPPEADKVAPNWADIASAIVRKLADHERELDACSREVRDLLFAYGFVRGCELEQEGRIAGRRDAKDLTTPPKKRGRPPEIPTSERAFQVVETGKLDQTIAQRVNYFLTAFRLGQRLDAGDQSLNDELRLADLPPAPPDYVLREVKAEAEAEAGKWCRAYYRHRQPKPRGQQWSFHRRHRGSAGNHI